jgi:hypothetical protein
MAKKLAVLAAVAISFVEPRECGLEDIISALPPRSAALRAYVSNVYGPASDDNFARWRDADFAMRLRCCIDVLYKDLLPAAQLGHCEWPLLPSIPGSVYRKHYNRWGGGGQGGGREPLEKHPLLWVYRYDTQALCPASDMPDSLRVHNASAEWVEVFHQFSSHYAEQQGLRWMYRARGSGLWYRQRRVFEGRNDSRLFPLLGVGTTWRSFGDSAKRWREVREWALNHGIDTFVFTHRCERWSPGWHYELVEVTHDAPRSQLATNISGLQLSTPEARALSFLQNTCLARFGRGYGPAHHEPCNCCVWHWHRHTLCFGRGQDGEAAVRYGLEGEPWQPLSAKNTRGIVPYIRAAAQTPTNESSLPDELPIDPSLTEKFDVHLYKIRFWLTCQQPWA